jgi:hypothetical protein
VGIDNLKAAGDLLDGPWRREETLGHGAWLERLWPIQDPLILYRLINRFDCRLKFHKFV